MKTLLAFVAAAAIAGCAGNQQIVGSGERADPPDGLSGYCVRHPDDAACPRQP